MQPTLGRIVLYTISDEDAAGIADHRVRKNLGGAPIAEGDVFPAIIVRVWPDETVNLRVLLDGHDFFWAIARTETVGAGAWAWPKIT